MREILFRGKRIDNGSWIEGDIKQDNDLEHYYISGWYYYQDEDGWQREPLIYEVDPATAGQFTGLTDKNGKKIFEGDILSRPSYWGIRIDYENGCFMVRNSNSVQYVNLITNCPLCDFSAIANYEVIGNIHDNPELLEAGGVQ